MQYFSKDLEVIENDKVALSFFTDLTTLDEVETLYIYSSRKLKQAVTNKASMLPPYNTWDNERKCVKAIVAKPTEMKYKLLRGESLVQKVKNSEQHVGHVDKQLLDTDLPIFSGVSILKVGDDFNDYLLRGKFICSQKNLRILYAIVVYLRDNNLFKILDGLAKGTAEDGTYYEMLREVVVPFRAFMSLAENKFATLMDLSSVTDYDYANFGEEHFTLSQEELKSLINKGSQYNNYILQKFN